MVVLRVRQKTPSELENTNRFKFHTSHVCHYQYCYSVNTLDVLDTQTCQNEQLFTNYKCFLFQAVTKKKLGAHTAKKTGLQTELLKNTFVLSVCFLTKKLHEKFRPTGKSLYHENTQVTAQPPVEHCCWAGGTPLVPTTASSTKQKNVGKMCKLPYHTAGLTADENQGKSLFQGCD